MGTKFDQNDMWPASRTGLTQGHDYHSNDEALAVDGSRCEAKVEVELSSHPLQKCLV